MSLPIEHIKVGSFIWYSGATSMWEWDCPAMIHKVDIDTQQFWVTSLDDLVEQRQSYDFKPSGRSSDSRDSMRAISAEEARAYLVARKEGIPVKIAKRELEIKRLTEGLAYMREQIDRYDKFIERTKV